MQTNFAIPVVESSLFQRFFASVILLNAVFIFLDSYPQWFSDDLLAVDAFFNRADDYFVYVYCLEIAIKIYAYRSRFFRDGWNLFDVLVIAPSLIPALQMLTVARVFRVVRILRLISSFSSFRSLTTAMMRAVGDTASICGVILVFLFIFGAISQSLFKGIEGGMFDDIGMAMYTLFRAFAFFEASTIVDQMGDNKLLGGFVIYPFFIMMTYLVMNFFVAIAMFYLGTIIEKEMAPIASDAEYQAETTAELEDVNAELAEIKATLRRIEERLSVGQLEAQ